jgi:transcriptional regulator
MAQEGSDASCDQWHRESDLRIWQIGPSLSGRERQFIFALTFKTLGVCLEALRVALAMSDERATILKGTLDLLILKVVALGPVHGYAISQRIQQVSKDYFQLQEGSLYPALYRLEDRGLLEAEWRATDTGREAKFYKLTKKGRRRLETELESWERMTEAVALILRMAE